MHGKSYVLTPHLATDEEIDHAVQKLIDDVKAAGAAAKRQLKEYKSEAH